MHNYHSLASNGMRQLVLQVGLVMPWSCAGDMDDLLELLFPADPQLSFKQLHMQEPATITSRLATRGEHCGDVSHGDTCLIVLQTCHRPQCTSATHPSPAHGQQTPAQGSRFNSVTMSSICSLDAVLSSASPELRSAP